MAELQLRLVQQAELGEGLQWHGPSGRWWWTDIEGRSLQAWTPGDSGLLVCRLPERCGSFAFTRSGRLLLGLAKRLALAELADARACGRLDLQPRTLVELEPERPDTRCNDGRCDRSGAFVFGTLHEAAARQPVGSFYQYSARHGLRRLALGGVAIANAICFSRDGRRMFHADTLQRSIRVCDYDSDSARVGTPHDFVKPAGGAGWPDGAVVDAEDGLWNAEWGGASVARYAPDGRLLARHTLAAPHASCPALGGPAGNELLVSSARQDLDAAALAAHPQSGSLFGLRLPGALALPEPLFDDAGL